MEEKKKMKKSTKIIIIVLSVIAVIILVDIIISANKEDLTEEISGESFLSDMSDTMESQQEGEISEIDDAEDRIIFFRDKLHWKWSDIAKVENYSERQVRRKYKIAKNKI